MTAASPLFSLQLATDEAALRAAQRLRYDVFVNELGGDGSLVDHENRLEKDRFDPYFDHLILKDETCGPSLEDQVVGVYRLLLPEGAEAAGQYYSEDEYDLTALRKSGRRLLELGRSCLHRDYRGGVAMYHLWNGLVEYVTENNVEILFGVASFHGTDINELAPSLSLLHHRHLAPEDIRTRAQPAHFQSMDLIPEADLNRPAAMRAVPALIKAYLKLGGYVGEGAYIDHAFNTTDVCLIVDTERLNPRQSQLYTKERPQ